jgi:5-methylcytosine-specific restriction protein A
MYQFKVIGHAERIPSSTEIFWSDKKKIESYLGGYSIFEKLNKVDKSTLSFEYFKQENLIPDATFKAVAQTEIKLQMIQSAFFNSHF